MTGGMEESVGQEKECVYRFCEGSSYRGCQVRGCAEKQGRGVGLRRSRSSVLQTRGSCALQGLRQESDHVVLPGT